MFKFDFKKDSAKILLGMLAVFGICNTYFALTGNLPEKSVGFTAEKAMIEAIIAFVLFALLFSIMYLRKNHEKMTMKDFFKMLLGGMFLFIGASFMVGVYVGTAIASIIFAVSLYFGFLRK